MPRCIKLSIIVFKVQLVGGRDPSEGNVWARLPNSNVSGPVCSSFFDFADVRLNFRLASDNLDIDVSSKLIKSD